MYSRRKEFSPQLEPFFGFSEQLYNLVNDFFDLYKSIPIEDTDRVWSSYYTYMNSGLFEIDLMQLKSVLNDFLNSDSDIDIIGLLIFAILSGIFCAIWGFFSIIITIFRITIFVIKTIYYMIKLPIRLFFYIIQTKYHKKIN